MRRLILAILLLLLPGAAFAQGQSSGYVIVPNCTNVPSPVKNKLICWNFNTQTLAYWNGTTYVTIAGASGVVTSVTGTAGQILASPTVGAVVVSLVNTAVTPGTYGDATHVSQITFDSKGRATSAASVAISGAPPTGAAGGDLTGTYPNPTLAAIITAGGPTGDATHVPQITYDAKGRLTAVSSVLITGVAPSGAAGGDLSGTYPNPTVAKVNAVAYPASPSTNTVPVVTGSNTVTYEAVPSAALNLTTTSCTNQFVSAISAGGVGTCTTDTLAGAQHANQGTTTTVLHGNAAGNPSWAAVVSADLNITTTTCSNQFVRSLSSGAVGTCATVANADLTNSTITLNAGTSTGYTAPGAMSLGSTYTFGATTDTIRMLRLGLGAAPDATASLWAQQNGIAATSTDGFVLVNTTTATVGTQGQWSPRIRLRGSGWHLSAGFTEDWIIENQVSGGATSKLVFSYSESGAAYTKFMDFDPVAGKLNLSTAGTTYGIAGTSVLSSTILGSTVVTSSLTSTGIMTSGTLSTGYVVGGVTMTLGSDATGDIYYRNSSGVLTRLAVGPSSHVLIGGTNPAWSTTTGITAVGTIATGVWQGTAVAAGFGGTGQTTYTKGDILVASASTTLTKLAVGPNTHILTADSTQTTGVKWAAAAAANVDTCTSVTATNASWSVPAGTTNMRVRAWGAGGSGAGGNTTTTQRGAGGGSGGFCEKNYTGTMDATLNITIGAGGAAVTSGAGGADGNDGTATSVVGANLGTMTANGGTKGTIANVGGSGGTASGCDTGLNMTGGDGGYRPLVVADGVGWGAAAPNGGGTAGSNSTGVTGRAPGGGGGSSNHVAASNSGAGAAGLVVVCTR